MSKLLVAFVHRDDAAPLADALRDSGHRFTQLPSIGGFLGSDNGTFVLGLEDRALPEVVSIFEHVCHGRDVDLPLVLTERLEDWQARTVSFGGATILVAELSDIIRI